MKVLMYHNIDHPPKASKMKSLYVSPQKFQRQMQILRSMKFRVVEPNRFVEGKRSVMLTFDDGYKDFLEKAYPILKKMNLPAIVFVPAKLVGSYNVWDSHKLGVKKYLMDWEELSFLVKEGIKIGSHTLTHPFLTRISPSEARKEIEASKKLLEDKLGIPIDSFCYPYGDYNQEIKKMVAEAGYRYAYTTVEGDWRREDDPLEIKRIYVSGYWTSLRFLLKILI